MQAVRTLLTVDVACLKRETAICKDQRIECMAVRQLQQENGHELTEVWVGSGCAGRQSQVSWFRMGTGTGSEIPRGMMVGGKLHSREFFCHKIYTKNPCSGSK